LHRLLKVDISNAYTIAFVFKFVVKFTGLLSPLSADAHLLHTYCLNERRKDDSFARGLLERVFSLQISQCAEIDKIANLLVFASTGG